VTGTAAAKPRVSGRAGLDGSRRADRRPAGIAAAPFVPVSGPAAAVAFSFDCSKVAGIGRNRHRSSGQMTTNARPTTALSGIVPPPGSPRWSRASSEMSR
jgi:hypothetical protein